ncbi:arsenate reductase (glutaredoxin) [Maribacter hydrothermalis]|uniref:Arsenate reductase (Glutaredoxin) n=1 Tax=Maribacter hydrothermalis TaxID=1836467 RepID=A0A1B7ZCN0_9FLAO|nr:arsenate reductase (glutaredoxin) [Maribacter hydrothermalis]APQ18562.1 arsenate reductase (glutaredoxin) [Maribacter hydrothermalis]OBR40883.1 arsenate reductase (glutaredoxin) [Maribacter hydrothermalis]
MIKIYHNSRCSKSREGLSVLENSGKKFEIVKYLEDIPTKDELRNIISCLGIKPINLVRKTEAIWKEKFKNLSLSDEELLDAMITYPKLIERPIIINGKSAVIGRPASNIKSIL